MKTSIESVSKNLVKVRVRISAWTGNAKSLEGRQELAMDHAAEADAVTVGLHILPKALQKQIRDHSIGIRKVVKSLSLPFEDGGYRILKSSEYSRLNKEVQRRKDAFENFVYDEIYLKYNELTHIARKRLGSLFNEDMFPDSDQILKRFGVRMSVQPVENLDDLQIKGISNDELEEIKRATKEELENNLLEGQMDLVRNLRKMVENIIDKTDKEGSRYKRALENLKELCDSVPMLNIFESEELNNLAKSIKEKIAETDSDSIKDDPKVAKAIKVEASSFVDALDQISF